MGAQNGNPPELFDWLKQQNEKGTQILSVCVGAAKLAKAGLLDGHYATSHHDYLQRYDEIYPKVHWLRGRRYVRATNNIYTAAGDGLSGIDLSLHIVDMRFGRKIAQGIADYLEYHSDEWKREDQATDAQSSTREVDRLEIIRAYKSARAAHFHHDAAAFLASHDNSWYLVADGTVALRTTAEEKPRVQAYFDSVKFADITDLDPPRVEVSLDGTMAWLLGHVRVRGTQRKVRGVEVPLAFDAAWIDVWQKKPGGWRIVARANAEKDDSPPR